MSLRKKLIRIAYKNPQLREDLIPIIEKTSTSSVTGILDEIASRLRRHRETINIKLQNNELHWTIWKFRPSDTEGLTFKFSIKDRNLIITNRVYSRKIQIQDRKWYLIKRNNQDIVDILMPQIFEVLAKLLRLFQNYAWDFFPSSRLKKNPIPKKL